MFLLACFIYPCFKIVWYFLSAFLVTFDNSIAQVADDAAFLQRPLYLSLCMPIQWWVTSWIIVLVRLSYTLIFPHPSSLQVPISDLFLWRLPVVCYAFQRLSAYGLIIPFNTGIWKLFLKGWLLIRMRLPKPL
jgi:hypothetical protein